MISFIFLLIFLLFFINFSCCDDSFETKNCFDVVILSQHLGQFCFIYTISGCQSASLDLRVTRQIGPNTAQLYSTSLSKGSSYSFGGSFASATCDVHFNIPDTPWTLNPTYAIFSVKGNVHCSSPIGSFDRSLDQQQIEVGEDCTAYSDCVSCLQSGRCGWCESGAGSGLVNKMCTAERKNETQPYCSTCGQWIFNQVATCPGYVPPTTTPVPVPGSTGGGAPSTADSTKDHTAKAVGIAVAVGVSIVGLGIAGVFCYLKRRPKYTTHVDASDGVELRDGQLKEESLNYAPPQRTASSSVVDNL